MTMKFTKDSGLVKTWVSLVLCGVFTLDQVPNLFNLKIGRASCRERV